MCVQPFGMPYVTAITKFVVDGVVVVTVSTY